MLLKKGKETQVKFSPGFSANRPSNNWAQIFCGTPSLGAPACSLRSAVCSLQMSYTAKPGLTTDISHW